MHECPECGKACDCDGEDTWFENYQFCECDCWYEPDYDSDYELERLDDEE